MLLLLLLLLRPQPRGSIKAAGKERISDHHGKFRRQKM